MTGKKCIPAMRKDGSIEEESASSVAQQAGIAALRQSVPHWPFII